MGTNYLAPIWRQPEDTNKDKLSNYSIQWQDGSLGNIISFQADVNSTTNPFLPSTTDPKLSLSAFFNLQGGSGERIIISEKVSGSATHWKLSINTNDQLEFVARTDAGPPYYTTITGGTTISDNSWHHVALVWDGTNFNLYLDGVSDASPVAASTFYYTAAYNSWGTIGSQRYTIYQISNRFSGQLSQICYFDYPLSTDQVTYLSNINNPMAITGAEPLAYWPLGDNSNPNATAGYPNISVGADSVFDFDSSGPDYIVTKGIDIGKTNTLSFWIKRTAVGNQVILNNNHNNAWYNYIVRLVSNGDILYATNANGASTTFDNANTRTLVNALNVWTNIVIVRTGQDVVCYVNN